MKGSRAVRLGTQLEVPPESPASEWYLAGAKLREECHHTVAYLPEPLADCTPVMTTTTVKGVRPAVIACDGRLLLSGIRLDCLEEQAMTAWVAALDWE